MKDSIQNHVFSKHFTYSILTLLFLSLFLLIALIVYQAKTFNDYMYGSTNIKSNVDLSFSPGAIDWETYSNPTFPEVTFKYPKDVDVLNGEIICSFDQNQKCTLFEYTYKDIKVAFEYLPDSMGKFDTLTGKYRIVHSGNLSNQEYNGIVSQKSVENTGLDKVSHSYYRYKLRYLVNPKEKISISLPKDEESKILPLADFMAGSFFGVEPNTNINVNAFVSSEEAMVKGIDDTDKEYLILDYTVGSEKELVDLTRIPDIYFNDSNSSITIVNYDKDTKLYRYYFYNLQTKEFVKYNNQEYLTSSLDFSVAWFNSNELIFLDAKGESLQYYLVNFELGTIKQITKEEFNQNYNLDLGKL